MKHTYKTSGTCSSTISFDITDGIITDLVFTGGCNGNLKGIGQLVEGMKAEIPDAMIENRCNQSLQDFAYRLQMQGMNLDTYLQYTGSTADDFKASFRQVLESHEADLIRAAKAKTAPIVFEQKS